MTPRAYSAPEIIETRSFRGDHIDDLLKSGIDVAAAGLCGVSSIDHDSAYDLGIRGESSLDGLCFRYWEPLAQRFSDRFVRLKPRIQANGRKYLQPVGERPRLYFVAGTTAEQLTDTALPILLTEGEKKVLSLDLASREVSIRALIIGVGGVLGWRYSPKELQPDGSLGKGTSRAMREFDSITWSGRRVYIVFDNDVLTNWKVQVAETELAKELARRGAEVYIVRLPEMIK